MNKIKIDFDTAIGLTESNNTNNMIDKFAFDEFSLIIVKNGKDCPPMLVDVSQGTEVFTFMIPYIYKGKPSYLSVKADGNKPLKYTVKYIKEYIEYVGDADRAEKLTYIFCDLIRSITYHVMNYQRDRREAHPVPRKYSREHRLSTSQNKIYLLDDIIKYVHDNYVPQGGHHDIKCPCWEVRGHYRHYKSGKVIFIPSYKKGKDREQVEPKEKEYYV